MALRLASITLESLGYSVLSAANGLEALPLCEKTPVAILVTDVMMPRMSGMELAGRVQTLWPKTRTLFLSGYSAAAAVSEGVLAEGVAFLEKPFSPRQLANKVREVLDQPS